MQNKCEKCVNSRFILSKNGYHAICALHPKTAAKCAMGKENHFEENLRRKRDYNWLVGDKNAE